MLYGDGVAYTAARRNKLPGTSSDGHEEFAFEPADPTLSK